MIIIPADRQEFNKNLTIVQVLNFQAAVHSLNTDCELSYLLTIDHATWHHSCFTHPPDSSVGEVLLLVQEC